MDKSGSPSTYNTYILRARSHEAAREYDKALAAYRIASSIHQDLKLFDKIDRLKKRVELFQQELDPANLEDLPNTYKRNKVTGNYILGRFILPNRFYEALFQYQKEGVLWMWNHFEKKHTGCVLADEMGLGKTFQAVSFISSLFYSHLISTAIVVVPQTLLEQWKDEFESMKPEMKGRVSILHSQRKDKRKDLVQKIQKKGGVLITTYGMVLHNTELLGSGGRKWDCVVLDEGHIVRNDKNKTTSALSSLKTRFKLVITGTPIQNNLRELWAVMNFVCEGKLLGKFGPFNKEFIKPIEEGQRDAEVASGRPPQGASAYNSIGINERITHGDLNASNSSLSKALAKTLYELTSPYILQREKSNKEILGQIRNSPELQNKDDLVIWLKLTKLQYSIYSEFLSSPDVAAALNKSRSPLAAITVLMKICSSPRLLLTSDTEAAQYVHGVIDPRMSSKALIDCSIKLKVLFEILEGIRNDTADGERHRVTVFSTSLVMLDMIEYVSLEQGVKFVRLDGREKDHKERKRIVDEFNDNEDVFMFLLSTKVGGFGLNLVGADRAVIIEPGWNPSVISQAVDRIHRIGQTKRVVIYRLLTAGTVEEKMYNKQLFKDRLTDLVVNERVRKKYFTKELLSALFSIGDTNFSMTHRKFQSMGTKWAPEVQREVNRVSHINGVVGCHDHSFAVSQYLSEISSNSDVEAKARNALKRIMMGEIVPEIAKKENDTPMDDVEDEEEEDEDLDDLSMVIDDMDSMDLESGSRTSNSQQNGARKGNSPEKGDERIDYVPLGRGSRNGERSGKTSSMKSLAEIAREMDMKKPPKGSPEQPISAVTPGQGPRKPNFKYIDDEPSEDIEMALDGNSADDLDQLDDRSGWSADRSRYADSDASGSEIFLTPTNETRKSLTKNDLPAVSNLTMLLRDEYKQGDDNNRDQSFGMRPLVNMRRIHTAPTFLAGNGAGDGLTGAAVGPGEVASSADAGEASPLSRLKRVKTRGGSFGELVVPKEVYEEQVGEPSQVHFTQAIKDFKYLKKSKVKDSSATRYNALIERMEQVEQDNPLEALRFCLDAIEIYDGNPALQLKAVALSHRLQMWGNGGGKNAF